MRRTLITLLLAVAAAVLVALPVAATEGGGGGGGEPAEQSPAAEDDGLWDGLLLAALIAVPVGLAIYVDANAGEPVATSAHHD